MLVDEQMLADVSLAFQDNTAVISHALTTRLFGYDLPGIKSVAKTVNALRRFLNSAAMSLSRLSII